MNHYAKEFLDIDSSISLYLKGLSSKKEKGQKWYQLIALPLKNRTALVLHFFIDASLRILRFKFSAV